MYNVLELLVLTFRKNTQSSMNGMMAGAPSMGGMFMFCAGDYFGFVHHACDTVSR
jgi:hypothetical protein